MKTNRDARDLAEAKERAERAQGIVRREKQRCAT